jgi:hypothetical protein
LLDNGDYDRRNVVIYNGNKFFSKIPKNILSLKNF